MGVISYSYLLKKVYNSGFHAYEKDEQDYRKMEEAYDARNASIFYGTNDEVFKRNFETVRTKLFAALEELITVHGADLNDPDRNIVTHFLEILGPEFYDKELLDDMLVMVCEMLSRYNGD